jgi:hypothetical protein
MGALRINLTNGTSTFIDLTTATQVSVESSDEKKFAIGVDGNNYVVQRFGTKNPEDGSGVNDTIWEFQMVVAYTAIAMDPIRYGYPDLGGDYVTYIQYDDEKFLASAIDSALSNIAEPAVLSNRTAIATQITDSDGAKALLDELNTVTAECENEASNLADDCAKVVADASCTSGYDFGGVKCDCDDAACCQATKAIYERNCVSGALDAIVIDWKHQYLFESVGGENP